MPLELPGLTVGFFNIPENFAPLAAAGFALWRLFGLKYDTKNPKAHTGYEKIK
ncbi:MAG: hypothetical protein IPL65_00905 [Lewinellaceae bacterium]|nr:hypothetical protein [Lewinellaceae bacterium]